MWSLRWILLVLGALLILGVYLWGRGVFRRASSGAETARVEPTGSFRTEALDDELAETRSGLLLDVDDPQEVEGHDASGEDASVKSHSSVPEAERVVTLRLVTRSDEGWNAQTVVLALRAAGLQHGQYGIFHRLRETGSREPLFSVANLTEPGSFDLTKLAETTLPGMSFFLVLPGVGDPVERFDMMVDTARSLARELDGELHDDRGSSWSIQRERYVREQIIEYRYQLERS